MQKTYNLYPDLLKTETSQQLVLNSFDKVHLDDKSNIPETNKDFKNFLLLNDFDSVKSLNFWTGAHRNYCCGMQTILKTTGSSLTELQVKSGTQKIKHGRHIFRKNAGVVSRLKKVVYEGPLSQINLISASRFTTLEELTILSSQQKKETEKLAIKRFKQFSYFIRNAHSFTFDEASFQEGISIIRDVIPIIMKQCQPTSLKLKSMKLSISHDISDHSPYILQNLDKLEEFDIHLLESSSCPDEVVQVLCSELKQKTLPRLKSCSLDFLNCGAGDLLLILLECFAKSPLLTHLSLKFDVASIPKQSKPRFIALLFSLQHLEQLEVSIIGHGQTAFIKEFAARAEEFKSVKTLKKLSLYFSNAELRLEEREADQKASLPEFLSTFSFGNLQQLELYGKNLSGLWNKPLLYGIGMYSGTLSKLRLVATNSAKGLIETLAKIKKPIYLEELSLRREGLELEDIKKLRSIDDLFVTLHTLDLSNNKFIGGGLRELSKCSFMSKISTLVLEGLPFEKSEIFVDAFNEFQLCCTGLRSLSLQHNPIGRMQSKDFFKDLNIPSLHFLNVSACKVKLLELIRRVNVNSNMGSLKAIKADLKEFQDENNRFHDEKPLPSKFFSASTNSYCLKVGVVQKRQIKSPDIQSLIMASLCIKRLRHNFEINYPIVQEEEWLHENST